jgi:hypothetical protein
MKPLMTDGYIPFAPKNTALGICTWGFSLPSLYDTQVLWVQVEHADQKRDHHKGSDTRHFSCDVFSWDESSLDESPSNGA